VEFDVNFFVHNSNKIEGIPATKGLQHSCHVAVASAVMEEPKSFVADVRLIHTLLGPVFDAEVQPGQFRTKEVFIGSREMPKPAHIANLMLIFAVKVQDYLATVSGQSHMIVTSAAWELHDYLVCVHPFADGNGRVARLFMNAFRQVCGQGWETVLYEDKELYIDRIRSYERRFASVHCDVYQ